MGTKPSSSGKKTLTTKLSSPKLKRGKKKRNRRKQEEEDVDEDEVGEVGVDSKEESDIESSKEDDVKREDEEDDDKERKRIALTNSGLVSKREMMVEQVCSMLEIDKPLARHLLAELDWDPQNVIEKYIDQPEKLAEKGINLPVLHDDNGNPKKEFVSELKIVEKNTEEECTVCLDETKEFGQLGCGHAICLNCWKEHIELLISNGHSYDIYCPWSGCKEYVPDDVVRKLVNSEMWQKYSMFMSNKMVDNSKVQKWCVASGCGKAIVEPSWEGSCLVGKCSCGMTFCWYCAKEAHSPATCKQMEQWGSGTSKDEIENLEWISNNTKACTKCKNRVEKQGGCYQMTCRCGNQFCWLCGKPWNTHTDHFTCSTFPEAGRPEVVGNAVVHKEVIFTAVDKILQYNEIEKELKSAEELVPKQIEMMKKLKDEALLFDESPLIKAQQQLKLCRRLIKHTVIRRAFEETEEEILWDQQRKLHGVVKKLSQKYEKEFLNCPIENFNFLLISDIKKCTNEAITRTTQVLSEWAEM